MRVALSGSIAQHAQHREVTKRRCFFQQRPVVNLFDMVD